MKHISQSLIFLLLPLTLLSQKSFQFYGENSTKQSVRFKLINNLIVIPLTINDAKLSFILDTGVNQTILFNLSENDSIGLNNVENITLQGLGSGAPINALVSKNNRFSISKLISPKEDLYVILGDVFNISSRMGTTIHGIIGYDLLQNVITKVNYASRTITFYNPEKYDYKTCRKCQEFPLVFYRNKPYIDVAVQLDTLSTKQTPVKLLIDSGGSDAIWLFEGSKKGIRTPKKFFKDILGEGLSGTIYGNRSKIPALNLGDFEIKSPTVSFLDSLSTYNARKFKERNGSIGGNILKRFIVWLDYPNKKLVLKKNGSLKKGFYYNMSGLHVIYSGKELVKIKASNTSQNIVGYKNPNSSDKTFSFVSNYFYKFKPVYRVDNVVPGSPADMAGLKKNDLLRKVNGKFAYEYQLGQITSLFQSKPGRKVKLEIRRSGVIHEFSFRLKERI